MNVNTLISNECGELLHQQYIPAGRGMFALISKQFMSLDVKLLDNVTSRFIMEVMFSRQKSDVYPLDYLSEEVELSPLQSKAKEILKGTWSTNG